MSKKNQSDRELARRRLLKTIAGGGVVVTATALPQKWTKPMVDQVLLPAHAGISGCSGQIDVEAEVLILTSGPGSISITFDSEWELTGNWNTSTGEISITSTTIPSECDGTTDFSGAVLGPSGDVASDVQGVSGEVEIDWTCESGCNCEARASFTATTGGPIIWTDTSTFFGSPGCCGEECGDPD